MNLGTPNPIPHIEVQALFGELLDQELPSQEELRVRAHLDGCESCRKGWQSYATSTERVRALEREKVPAGLGKLILRRAQRRSFLKRSLALHSAYRVPAELWLVVMAAAVAAWVLTLLSR